VVLSPFSQEAWACRCDWGLDAVSALAPADVTIVVDVLSFTTSVDVATVRGVTIFPYPWDDATAAEFAAAQQATLAGRRGEARYSLSPASYLDAPPGLRCVLPSLNGAKVTLLASAYAPTILAGCLRNARAVAEAAQHLGRTINVIPAGERWPDGSMRPALEDWLGAGAILSWLPRSRSLEAESAVALFEYHRERLAETLAECASGRELAARGHPQDMILAGELNVSSCVPRYEGIAFVGAS